MKDHAAAGKIVVLMGAVGTTKPEPQAAKDLEAFATPLTMKSPRRHVVRRHRSAAVDAGRRLRRQGARELVLIGKQFLYVERYMKLLAPRWQRMSDPQLTGYFANFMVEVSRVHSAEAEV